MMMEFEHDIEPARRRTAAETTTLSAYVVGTDHIDLLVTAGLLYSTPSNWMRWTWGNPSRSAQLDHLNTTEVGMMLLAENLRSVDTRYQEQGEVEEYEFRATHDVAGLPALGLILEAIDCYEYQACETADWRETQAFAFCEALRHLICREVPGRGDGWDWRRPEGWRPSRLVSITDLIPTRGQG